VINVSHALIKTAKPAYQMSMNVLLVINLMSYLIKLAELPVHPDYSLIVTETVNHVSLDVKSVKETKFVLNVKKDGI
jgi:hypothetical protein